MLWRIQPGTVEVLITGPFVGIMFVLIPSLQAFAAFTRFIGVAVAGGTYWMLMRRTGARGPRGAGTVRVGSSPRA